MKFIHLYTSPTYEDFHSLLVQPEQSLDPNQGFGLDDEKHRFSPIICRSVCDGGHIVWANTKISEGLTGRNDLPLNTAVGVPICSIGNDLYILVLFAVGIITMTPQAVEYLTTIARVVAEGADGFLSASFSSSIPVTPAKTEDFVGLWDINELLRKYTTEVEFHLFPMGKLQKFFDCHEILLFCDLFLDFKLTRDGRFTVKQLESLRETFQQTRERSDSTGSDESKEWNIDTEIIDTDNCGVRVVQENPFINEADVGHGVYSADLNSLEMDELGNSETQSDASRPRSRSFSTDVGRNSDISKSVLHIYAHMTYKLGQCRFHEFMIAILGMTIFECSELWLVNERKGDLQLVAAVYRSPEMRKWIALSETLRLKVGVDLPGKVVESGTSHWESSYGKSNANSECDDLRIRTARELGVNMAFGVPLPGLRGICGSVIFYSSRQDICPSSLLFMLIEKAIHLMAVSSVDNTIFPKLLTPHQSFTDLQNAAISSSTTSNCSSYANSYAKNGSSLVRRKSVSDFDQRLELCRSIVSNRGAEKGTQHPMARKRNSSGKLKQLGAIAAAAAVAEEIQEFDGPTLPPGFVFSPIPTASELPVFPPSVNLNAAIAVSQFGSVGWQKFIPGGYDGTMPNVSVDHPLFAPSMGVPPIYSSTSDSIIPPSTILTMYSVDSIPASESAERLEVRSYVDSVLSSHSGGTEAMPLPTELPQCKMEGCAHEVESPDAQFCVLHRASKRCHHDGCNKCAQGGTKFCIAHGGGRRCTVPGCERGARDKRFCAAHGGGKRCGHPGCTKSAVGGSNMCTAHGGGKRCQFPGCQKSSQSSTNFCVRHGGGRTCAFPDCSKVR